MSPIIMNVIVYLEGIANLTNIFTTSLRNLPSCLHFKVLGDIQLIRLQNIQRNILDIKLFSS